MEHNNRGMCDDISSMCNVPSLVVFTNVADNIRFLFWMGEELYETGVAHSSLFFCFLFQLIDVHSLCQYIHTKVLGIRQHQLDHCTLIHRSGQYAWWYLICLHSEIRSGV